VPTLEQIDRHTIASARGQSRICQGPTVDEGFQGGPPASMDQGIAQMTARGGPGPGLSVQYATLEILRVATQRGPSKDREPSVVDEATTDRTSEVLGEPAVDVVTLHAALAGRQ
jgi:K+-transporting ATPase c subunit